MSPLLNTFHFKAACILTLMSLSSNFLRFRRVVAFQSADTYSRSIVRRQQQIRIFSTTISEVNEKAYEELRWLSNEIRHHDDLYYNQQPQLKDDEYDALVRKEVEICEKYPELLVKLQEESGLGTRTTRNGRVGSSTSQKRLKREHLLAMLSLDNVHDEEQLSAWLKRVYKMTEETQSKDEKVLILTEPKLDGVSLSLRYELNEDKTYSLVWASTRGDGKKGQDVTQATSSIHNIPTSLPSLSIENVDSNLPAPIIEVRGEVVLLNNDFSQISSNQNLTYSFSNSRNAASGILLRKPSHHPEEQVEAERLQSLLKFYAYDLVEGTAEESLDGIQNRNLLEHFNFDVAQPHCLTELSITNVTKDDFCTPPDAENMIQFYKALDLHRQDKASSVSMAKQFRFLDFDMDGCVHKLVDPQLKKAMGGSNKSPNWAVAHKFSPVAVVTGLVDVIVQVGRTGALTPVALLEPVTVGGVNISRATLHNFGHLQEILGDEKSLPVNTSVMVRRAGDVIPQVVGRIKSEDNDKKSDKEMISLKAPTHCPACGSKVVWEESNQPSNNRTTGQVVRCGGPPLLCRPQAITSIAHAFSRDALDLTGLSEARIQQLMDVELLRFPCDLFNFSEEDWENMEELPGWGAKSVENLRSSTKEVASHGISLNRFVYSLGIRQIGKHSSELVASSYGTIEAFLEAVQNASEWRDPQEEEPSDVEKDSNNDDNSSTHPFSKMQGRLGIGPVLINSLLSFSKKRELVKAATDLGQAINVLTEYTEVEMQAEMARSSDKNELKPFQGFRVVFTGSIPSLTRSAAQKAAKEFLGAKATPGSVSKTTDLVVHGETGGKKLQQALYFGIRTMTGNEFLELLEENGAEKQ